MRREILPNLQKAVIEVLRRDATLAGYLGGGLESEVLSLQEGNDDLLLLQDGGSDFLEVGLIDKDMRLYDTPPDNPTYPFARISNIEVRPDDDDARLGQVVNMGIELADRPADRGESVDRQKAVETASQIAKILHRNETGIRARLTTDGTWFLIEARYETMSTQPQGDNLTYLAVAGFTFLIDEEE
ncbi:MAG: hypothetical protein OXG15_07245 [Gammaproteobacteria bacterium]|nr:hypothetical protein [Gammaproteobacteria bacterium]